MPNMKDQPNSVIMQSSKGMFLVVESLYRLRDVWG